MAKPSPRLYSTVAVSKLLGVAPATVVNWANKGTLKSHRTPGGHRRIAEGDLAAFAREYKMPLDQELLGRHGDKPRVLVVDAQADVRDLVVTMLEQGRGCEVEQAGTGLAAGLLVATFRPDAVLLDARLPGLDPFEALPQLRAHGGKKMAVVAVTGWTDSATRKKLEAAFDGCLEKPLDLDAMLETVDAVLKR